MKFQEISEEEVDFQLSLLKDAELIKTTINSEGRELPTRLTWKGIEYLDQTLYEAAGIV